MTADFAPLIKKVYHVSTQHLYCWVGLWPQNYKKIG